MKKLFAKLLEKKKYLFSMIGALLLGVAIVILYIMGGFRFIVGNEPMSKDSTSTKQTSKLEQEFNSKFRKTSLPFSIALNNVNMDKIHHPELDSREAKIYLNEYNKQYKYYACGRIPLSQGKNAYIVLKNPKSGALNMLYFIRIFDKNYSLCGQMKLAEFIGKDETMLIKEAEIKKDYTITVKLMKAVLNSITDSISVFPNGQVATYKINSNGSISPKVN